MVKCEQDACGYVPDLVPNVWQNGCSAAWSDAAAIMPWEIFKAYGSKAFLSEFYPMMRQHIDYIGKITKTPFLWTGCASFGDWLALDNKKDRKGATRQDFISSAFYAYSTSRVIKAGKALNYNVQKYEMLYENIRTAFIKTFVPETQTECALALFFDLTDNKKEVADRLAKKIRNCGNHLQTGFVGTPYLLYALSENGYVDLAYELLLREEFPSWLYSVKCGATTVWEHWDSKNENGDFWSADMNSFNHYAYGAVIAWVYEIAGGITPLVPGFKKIHISPKSTKRLESFALRLKTRSSEIAVRWKNEKSKTIYEIISPVTAVIEIEDERYDLPQGGEIVISK